MHPAGCTEVSYLCLTPSQPVRFSQGDAGCAEFCFMFQLCPQEGVVALGEVHTRSDTLLSPLLLSTPSSPPPSDRLVGLVVKTSASRAEDPGFESRLRRGRVIPVTSKLALQWLPCQAPGFIGSALGLAGPVSVYCGRDGKFGLQLLSQCCST